MGLKITELRKIDSAPQKGHILIYTRKEVRLEPYTVEPGADKRDALKPFGDADILELHMFDQEKEYRAIYTKSKRKFAGSAEGAIECIADFPGSGEEIYREENLLEPKFGKKICVLNHISYDEQGMATVDNYRLAMEG